MVATGTFCPAATLVAPQTICTISSAPKSTLVTLRRSAFWCCSQESTCPTTIPFKPPGTEEKGVIPSISRPKSVRSSPVCLASQSVLMNCLSQLYEIFIMRFTYISTKDNNTMAFCKCF